MSHRVIGNDAGQECFSCGGTFDCSKCQTLTEAYVAAGYPSVFDWQLDHECEADRLRSLVECTGPDDPASACKTDEHDGAHHWALAFPWIAGEGRNFQADDLVAQCHYCGIQRPAIEDPAPIRARAEALCNLHGTDPNDSEDFASALVQARYEWNDSTLHASAYPDSSGV